MGTSFRLSLIPGCRLAGDPPAALAPDGGEPIAVPAPLLEPVRLLLAGGATEEGLAGRALAAGFADLGRLYALLFAFHDRRLLRRSVSAAGEPLLTGVSLVASSPFGSEGADLTSAHALSRFALTRRIGDELVVESPLSPLRVTLHGPRAVALLGALARPRRVAELAAESDLDEAAVRGALDLLAYGRLLEVADEPRDLVHWQLHDLLFHARSRIGRHAGGYGASFRDLGDKAPPPALKPDMPGEVVELRRPDVSALKRDDLPFTRVLEERRSRREHGETPITKGELGELLYRAARVVEVVDGPHYEVARRPFPGGGGAYELEVYLVVGACQGLEPGLYHYRPRAHQLVRLRDRTPEVDQLLETAAHVARTSRPVQVQVVFAARFKRLSWKYESMVYATVLKDVGVAFQTFYLVGTAMGLGVCAMGGGDSDLFARASGVDYYEESAVGELVVGSLP